MTEDCKDSGQNLFRLGGSDYDPERNRVYNGASQERHIRRLQQKSFFAKLSICKKENVLLLRSATAPICAWRITYDHSNLNMMFRFQNTILWT